MSDGSPLLLNMGAELANTAGMNPSITPSTPSMDGGGGEFAAILQSSLNASGQDKVTNPLISSELETNPLLFSQQNGLENQLLKQAEISLEDLAGGKELPLDEQELAWQTELAEYDSTDPDTPRIVVASGDDTGYQLEEMTAEDLFATTTSGSNNKQQPQEPVDLNIETDLPLATLQDSSEKHTDSHAAIVTALNGQDTAKSTQPISATSENDIITNVVKQQRNQSDRNVHPGSIEISDIQTDEQAVTSQLDAGKTRQTLRQENLEGGNEAGFRNELNAAIEGTASRANTSTSASSNAITGASTYAAVSGIGAAGSALQTSAPVIANLTVPPQNSAWGEVVGDRVQWMVTQNIQEAKIRLNPPELGLLEVRVQMNDQQTNISFSSPHSQVRDALESAVPRLREMFGDSGLSLGDVNVSHQSMSGNDQTGQGDKSSGSSDQSMASDSNSNETSEVANTQHIHSSGTGMLDLYA